MKHRSLAPGLTSGAIALIASATVLAAPAFAATGQVDASVKDALGRPIPGAQVRLEGADGTAQATGTTDDAGHAILNAPPGVYSLNVRKDGFQPGIMIVTVGDGATATSLVTLAAEQALTMQAQVQRLNAARNQLSPETGSSITRIDRQSIEQLPRGEDTPTNQVLLQAPGVVQDTFGQLHIRGDHGNVQYRLNGILIPEGITGFGSSFDTRFVDHMDLLDGALPAQYGYRTAGVINVTTKSGTGTPGGRVDVQGGSHQDVEPSVQYGGSAGPLDFYVAGNYLQNSLGIDNVTPEPEAVHDFTRQGKGFAYGSALLNPDTRVSAIAGTAVQTFQIPTLPGQTPGFTTAGAAPLPSESLNDNVSPANHYGILALQGSLGDQVDYQIAGFTRYSSLHYTPDVTGDLQYSGMATDVMHASILGGFQGDGAWRLGSSHTVRFGTFLSAEQATINDTAQVFPVKDDGSQASDSPQTVVDNNMVDTYLLGVYAQDEWKLLDKVTLNYGLRFDLEDGFVKTNELQPRVGLVYQPVAQTTLHAGYARYFTPPATELISTTTAARFAGTTGAIDSDPTTQFLPVPERANYYDVGILQQLLPGLSVGLDGYYKDVQAIQDEGQFGRALVYSIFNYTQGKIMGAELSGSYRAGDLNAYANLTLSQALGTGILTGQYNFEADEAAYASSNWIHLDHDQLLTASGGVSYNFWGTRVGVDGLFGSGLRSGFANTETVAPYTQFDVGASHTFQLPAVGDLEVRGSVTNVLDIPYELRDDSGIGVEAAQYGPRRAYYVGVAKSF